MFFLFFCFRLNGMLYHRHFLWAPFFYLYNEKQARIKHAPVFNVDYAFMQVSFFRHFYSVVFNMDFRICFVFIKLFHVIILHTHISAAATDYVVYIIVSFTFCIWYQEIDFLERKSSTFTKA